MWVLALLVLVAPGSAVADACPNEAFRIGAGANLPDCRAYEQTTEIDKNGGSAGGFPEYIKASSDGERFRYYTQAGFPNGVGSQDYPSFLAVRGSTNWISQGLLPPQSMGPSAAVLAVSGDLRYSVVEARVPGVEPGSGDGLFIEDTTDRSIETIVPYNPNIFSYKVDDILADGSKVFFETNGRLTPNANFGPKLYVWERSTGEVSLVGYELGSEESPEEGAFGGPYDWYYNETYSGGATARYYVAESHAADTSGSQIYYTVAGSAKLLLRKGIGSASPSTVWVSKSQKTNGSGPDGTDPLGPKPAAFQEATPDGRFAFFLSSEELTDTANTGTEDQGRDLYRFDAETESLIDLAPDTTDADGAQVLAVLGASSAGDIVYFAANGVLADGATPGDCYYERSAGGPGTCNLYVWEENPGGTSSVKFISELETRSRVSDGDATNIFPRAETEGGAYIVNSARVDPSGEFLLYSSVLPLTGYLNESSNCPESGCAELFRYSNAEDDLSCVSCNPGGELPKGGATLGSEFIAAASAGRGARSPVQSRNLSAGGDRIFFQTPDALDPADTNSQGECKRTTESASSCQDVYEWVAGGKGACPASAGSDGCLHLLSSGQSAAAAYFGDADVSGDNAFIFTQDQLVPVDRDSLFDVYDARANGGLAAQHVLPPVPCASESACKPGQPAPVAGAPPGSSTFVGPGNPRRHKHPCKRHRKCKKHKKNHGKRRTAGRDGNVKGRMGGAK
jgi:hypothetical protein